MANLKRKISIRKDILESLLENISLSVNIFDKNGRRILVNPFYYTLAGKPQGIAFNHAIGAGGQKKKSEYLKKKVDQAIEHGKVSEIHNFFYRSSTKKTVRYFDIIIGPLRDKNGKIIGAYSTAKNVTTRQLARKKLLKLKALLEKKVLERTEKLEKANAKLKELSEERSFLVSDIAHEIKTILTIIRGNLEILNISQKAKEFGPLEIESYQEIMEEIDRMSHITSDLVFIAKTKEFAATFDFQKVDVCQILDDLVKSYRKILGNSIKIDFSKKNDKCRNFVWADREKLSTLFGNLIDNAVKFQRKENHSKISITSKKKDLSLEIYFRDNGVGIPKEKIPYIFSPFFQVEKSRANVKTNGIKTERGYGLGLAICKKIAAAHNGKIWAESNGENKGATFVVSLPLT